ncbi:dynamin family protein [Neobacillus cucumis]|uniref:dynamin family protein n=1 Tax=Neobacillus cucumis TaxID=1740721 RepID=UPI00204112EF|nr:dynamin family protein [Neobacillus cucumis]MCM3729125.1 dynamin family protein [Neobacillus cucumis]
MNYTAEKEKLKQKTDHLLQLVKTALPDSSQLKSLSELQEDLADDYYSIIVLGEFKHGKSTFVNALLGQDIMPRNVTPTTATINAVFHSKKPEVQILKMNGEIEKRELSVTVLNDYTASSDFDPAEINYLKLFMESRLLENRVVLIDTPGLNDLNQQRSDITYQFLPRADVVIFITSMDGALRSTEEAFIKNTLQKNGFEKLMIAANFLDRIDEEEIDDAVDFIERRAENILGEKTKIFPLSSKDALEARLRGDQELLEYSGLLEIEAEIKKRIVSGNRSQEKLVRFQTRLWIIAESLRAEIELAEHLSEETLEQLVEQVQLVSEWLSKQPILQNQLQNYIYECESEIQFIVRKSLNFFGSRMREDIENRIRLFQGSDIKSLVETQIPILIRSHFNQWIDQYNDHIHELLQKLAKEVSHGLSQSFKQTIKIKAIREDVLRFTDYVESLPTQTGNASVKAGLLMGGASSIALLLGASFFIPLVGMAGLPFLSQKIAEKQLGNVKPDLIQAVNLQINGLLDQFQSQLDQYIIQAVENIKDQAMDEYDRKLSSIQFILDEEIASKKQETRHITDYKKNLNMLKEFIKTEIKREEVVNGRV